MGKKTLLNCIKNKYLNNSFYTSFAFGKQPSFVSEKEEDLLDCIVLYYLVNIKSKNKQLVICLRFYDSEFTKHFFVNPQAIFLLYDITSKDSFDCVIEYYNDLIKDSKYKKIKYILLGNKIDLIDEENEEKENNDEKDEDDEVKSEEKGKNENIIENKKNKEKEEKEKEENNDEKEEKEKEENKNEEKEKKENKESEEYKNNDEKNDEYEKKEENEKNEIKQEKKEEKNNKIENEINNRQTTSNNKKYFKTIIDKEKFELTKEISGLNGFYIEELLNEIALILYKSINEMEKSTNEICLEGDSIFIDNKLEINSKQNSYHDIDYKKEINKINKPNNKPCCCLICEIF